MACANKIKTNEKKFRVLVLQCPDCGEERYYVAICDHCGATLEYKETKHLTLDEIKALQADGIEIYGDINQILTDDDDFDIPGTSESTTDGEVIPPLDDDEMNELFDSDEFGPL